MRRPLTALLTATTLALGAGACSMPEPPPDDRYMPDAPATPIGPAFPHAPVSPAAPPAGGPRTDAAAPPPTEEVTDNSPVASTTPGPLQDLLEAEGRFVVVDQRPPMPDLLAGAWDQPMLGTRGSVGVTCEDDGPNAFLIVASEHRIQYTTLTVGRGLDDPVENNLTGGLVELEVDGEELVVFTVPDTAGDLGMIGKAHHLAARDLPDLGPVDRVSARPETWRDVRPGQLAGAVTESDPVATETDWNAGRRAAFHDFYNSFQIWAPNNPVEPGAEVTFTYTLDEHIPVELTTVAPAC